MPEELTSERLIKHPEWYGASLQLLQGKYRIKDPIVFRIAEELSPFDLENVYSILKHTLGPDAEYFIRRVPSAFLVFKKSKDKGQDYIDSYIKALSRIQKLIYSKYNGKVPTEFNWRESPSSFADLKGLNDLESRLNAPYDNPSLGIDLSKLREKLMAYSGKRILFLGVRKQHQKETLIRELTHASSLTFHYGDDIKGISTSDASIYDVIVYCKGASKHDVTVKLKYTHGSNFNKISIYAFGAKNPERILEIMAQNANRFQQN